MEVQSICRTSAVVAGIAAAIAIGNVARLVMRESLARSVATTESV